MLVKTYAAAVQGIDALPITVEVIVERGAGFTLVGLPDKAVKESGDRVQSAIRQCGGEFPRTRVVVNMAPADVRKEGAAYDLPIAVGIMAADDKLPTASLGRYIIMGELSLDGSVLPIKGALPMAIMARKLGYEAMIVPRANATEAAVVNNITVYGVDSLQQVAALLRGEQEVEPTVVDTRGEFARAADDITLDFADVKGQPLVRRAVEVASAGGHNILMVGAPGSGKSMMAKRIPGILPPLTLGEALETTKIHSVAGKLGRGSTLMTARPFRSPHHTISPVALVGGGTNPMPGEISLAHNGVLFLDEFPEFPRTVLEVLRQPLEDRHINISRAKYTINYPAGFMLVASMNPCPCGYYNHPVKACTCTPGQVQRYINRISGPLLDRIDLHVNIAPVTFEEMSSTQRGEDSASIRARVVKAREIQLQRFAGEKGVWCNAMMDSRLIARHARPDAAGLARLEEAMERLSLSARAYDRILRVARTIADLAGDAQVSTPHIYEAIGYRTLDRATWGEGVL